MRSVLGAEIGADDPLMAAGLDSLGATELRNALQRTTGLVLPATVIFDHPTVAAMAAHLTALLSPGRVPGADRQPRNAVAASTAAQPAAVDPLFVADRAMRLPHGGADSQLKLQAADTCAPVPLQRWDVEARHVAPEDEPVR